MGLGRKAKKFGAVTRISMVLSGLSYLVVLGVAQPARAYPENPHALFRDADLAALHEYAQQIGNEQPQLVSVRESKSPDPHSDDPDLAALHEYGQQIGLEQPGSHAPRLRMAEADNAFDALREFLRGREQP